MKKKHLYAQPECVPVAFQQESMILSGSIAPLEDDPNTIEWLTVSPITLLCIGL